MSVSTQVMHCPTPHGRREWRRAPRCLCPDSLHTQNNVTHLELVPRLRHGLARIRGTVAGYLLYVGLSGGVKWSAVDPMVRSAAVLDPYPPPTATAQQRRQQQRTPQPKSRADFRQQPALQLQQRQRERSPWRRRIQRPRACCARSFHGDKGCGFDQEIRKIPMIQTKIGDDLIGAQPQGRSILPSSRNQGTKSACLGLDRAEARWCRSSWGGGIGCAMMDQ